MIPVPAFDACVHVDMHSYVRTQGESWEKVAVILATVDRSLGIDLNVAISNSKQQAGSTRKVC